MVSFADRMSGIKASDIRQLLAVASKPEIISFAGGLPAPELFPVQDIKAAYDAVLDEAGATALQYGATDGWAPLRKQISQRMLKKNNVEIEVFSEANIENSFSLFCFVCSHRHI